jgi:hypothetical protein
MTRFAAACLSFLSLMSMSPAALSEFVTAPVIVTLSVSPAPVPTDDSVVECRDASEWMAARRDWMSRGVAWCSVGIEFRYEGSGGDIKMVVSREASARAAPAHHASADLPANGGETSPFHFIFPCPPAGAERLCLSYEPVADAGELSYDFIELGVDASPGPVDSLEPQDRVVYAGTYDALEREPTQEQPASPYEAVQGEAAHDDGRKAAPPRLSVSYDAADVHESIALAQLSYVREVELTPPVPAPISDLRKRAR